MKKLAITTAILILAVCFFLGPSLSSADMPGADPRELWNYITKVSPYTQWSFWPDHQGMQPGRAPHGPLHKVYVNDRVLNSVRTPVQYGSIVVKESYSKAKELKDITIMYKINGYNPQDGDWLWAKYSPQGKAKLFGKPWGCIECHEPRANNDFIFVHEFK